MEFGWSDEDRRFREELVAFIERSLPEDWDDVSSGGP